VHEARPKCGDQDIFVNVAGGLRVDEPAADLGIVCAMVSSFLDRPLDKSLVVFGQEGNIQLNLAAGQDVAIEVRTLDGKIIPGAGRELHASQGRTHLDLSPVLKPGKANLVVIRGKDFTAAGRMVIP